MSYKLYTRITVTAGLLLFLLAGKAFGGTFMIAEGTKFPAYYPSTFQEAGTIHRMDSSKVIISGRSYTVSMNVLVHSMNTEHSSKYELGTGKEVGFTFTDLNNKRTITEMWLLPTGSVLLD